MIELQPEEEKNACQPINCASDTLWIADFETGQNPSPTCGKLSSWQDEHSGISVISQYDSLGGGANGSLYYGKTILKNNDGISPKNWSGGGMVMSFSMEADGHDIGCYNTLQLEAKMSQKSNLQSTRIKLEDIHDPNTPSRAIMAYRIYLTDEWQTITIPLDHFNFRPQVDRAEWRSLDSPHVIRFVTVSENKPGNPNVDGELCIDNVRLIK